jgi:acyltransferase
VSTQLDIAKERIQYIDVARLYAMAMVFYGHFIERVMMLNDPTAAALYKFIYSFHLLLFFILSGFISRDSDLEFGVGKFLKHRFFSRLLPFIFFTIVFMVLAAIFPGDFYHLKLPSVEGYIEGLVLTGLGIPFFCIPSWFLLMLFSVEVVHYVAFRFLKSDSKILFAIVAFYIIGYVINLRGDFLNFTKQRMYNILFIHEAITMYAFYLLGAYLRRRKFLMEKVSFKVLIPGVITAFLIVLFTFKLNTGPFNFDLYNSVVIIFAAHGNIFWFPLTAIAGSLFVFFLGKITPSQKTIVWMGQNTLILMCLNGAFYHYINPPVGKYVFTNFSGQPVMILVVGLLMAVVSLALCIPFIYLFNKYVPQLVGKPKINGPWLKNFI